MPTANDISDVPYDSTDVPHLYSRLVNLDPVRAVVSADATGDFPTVAANSDRFMLVFEYNGAIFVELMKSASAAQYALAYDKAIAYYRLSATNVIKFHLDNFVSTALKTHIKLQGHDIELASTYNHRALRAERAIATWKDHSVATLAGADPDFPVDTQWNKAKNIAMLTLSILTFIWCMLNLSNVSSFLYRDF